MDLSKLPKLSSSSGQEPAGNAPAEQAAPAAEGTPVLPPAAWRAMDYSGTTGGPGLGADIWFSVIVGLLLLYMGSSFARFVIAEATHQPFHTQVFWQEGPLVGTEVAYFDLAGFTAWSDMGIFLFGLVLLFEAGSKTALLLKPGTFSRGLLTMATGLTFLTVALNIFVCMKVMGAGIMPLMSGLAVAFGGWILADEWRMLKMARAAR